MSVTLQTPYNVSTGNGATTVFPYQFLLLSASDLTVYVDGALKTLTADYTVSNVGASGGGNVTFLVAPGNGLQVSLVRAMRQERLTDYQQLGDFLTSVVNPDFDRAILLAQDDKVQLQRSIRVPAWEPSASMVLPNAATRANTYPSFDSSGNLVVAASLPSGTLSAASIGAFLYPRTAAEISAGITPTNLAYPVGDVRRWGIVPNNAGVAATNTTALKALLLPNNNLAWDIYFPNTTGADTYYFNDVIQVASGTKINLQWCTLNFAKTYAASDDTMGFLTFVRDVTIENGSIVVNYTGAAVTFTAGILAAATSATLSVVWPNASGSWQVQFSDGETRAVTFTNGATTATWSGGLSNNVTSAATYWSSQNPGLMMRIGSRSGYKWGIYTAGIFDQDDLVGNSLPPMGNITLRNLRLNANTPNAVVNTMILMLGGLQNVTIENIVATGNGPTTAGPSEVFYYEFGFASKNGFPSTSQQWSSSHAQNLVFRNITATKMFQFTGAYAVDITEAFSVLAENNHSDSQYGTFQFRIGEAHFFRPWTANAGLVKRGVTLRNITAQTPIGIGISLNASQPTTAGYLADGLMIAAGLPVLTPNQKVDLMKFSLDGFAVNSAVGVATGIKGDGTLRIANGILTNCFDGIVVTGEATQCTIDEVEMYGCTGLGVRASDAAVIWSGRQKLNVRVSNSKICGGASIAVAFDNLQTGRVENCQLGYNTNFDATNEATQTTGVNVGSQASAVVCEGNYITSSAGTNGYSCSGTPPRGNYVLNARGPAYNRAGSWMSLDSIAGTSADRGDASISISYGGDFPVQYFNTPLTAARTVTISTTAGVPVGYIFRVVRTSAATGASTLTVLSTPNKALALGNWCDIQWNGTNWVLIANGAL
jgi:hypothetical protein